MKQLILGLLLLNLLTIPNFAQGEGALASLTMQRSLPLIGAGNIGAAKANSDPIGYYLNPAILGYTSQNNHASFFFMPSKTEWNGNSSITLNTYGFNIGYNLKDFSIPISVGFGYMYDILSYDHYATEGIDIFNSYDSFNNFSFGVGIDYFVLLNFGVSIKSYNSKLGDYSYSGRGDAKGTALDYGAMIIAPISKLFFDDVIFNFGTTPLKPTMNFTIGYSLTNVGDEIVYFDEAQSDPLSRTARLGYTFDFGFDTFINENKINLITYSFTAEAEDILINQKDLNYTSCIMVDRFEGYQSFLGDIDVNKHLIELDWDENIIVHMGHTINIFETFTFAFGEYAGRYSRAEMERTFIILPKTIGFGISSEGILKLWSISTDNTILNYFAEHIALKYYYANNFKGSIIETEMHGISLHMNNIEL